MFCFFANRNLKQTHSLHTFFPPLIDGGFSFSISTRRPHSHTPDTLLASPSPHLTSSHLTSHREGNLRHDRMRESKGIDAPARVSLNFLVAFWPLNLAAALAAATLAAASTLAAAALAAPALAVPALSLAAPALAAAALAWQFWQQ